MSVEKFKEMLKDIPGLGRQIIEQDVMCEVLEAVDKAEKEMEGVTPEIVFEALLEALCLHIMDHRNRDVFSANFVLFDKACRKLHRAFRMKN